MKKKSSKTRRSAASLNPAIVAGGQDQPLPVVPLVREIDQPRPQVQELTK